MTINTDLLFDEDGSFILEADLLVEMKLEEADKSSLNPFIEMIKSIFDEKNADVLIIAEDQEFKFHKSIFSARSQIFKNTFSHNTVESDSNTIVIKETPAQAVEDMLEVHLQWRCS